MSTKSLLCLTVFFGCAFIFCVEKKDSHHLDLLNRRYNDTSFAVTHNGQSCKGASGKILWLFSVQNQDLPLADQLKAGIRGIKITVQYQKEQNKHGKGVLTVCHGLQADELAQKFPSWFPKRLTKAIADNPHFYDKGAVSLKDLVGHVKSFLDANPDEVFTFFLEGNTKDHEAIAQAFVAAGMDPGRYMHVQKRGHVWPTLGQMIRNGKRVVVFVSSDEQSDNKPDWIHATHEYVWQTKYAFGSVEELQNDANKPKLRGGEGKRNFKDRFGPDKLSVVQHFVTPFHRRPTLYLGGLCKYAKQVNRRDILLARLKALYQKSGVPLNFIWVDFFEYGDLLDIVDQLNGVGKYAKDGPLFVRKTKVVFRKK